MALPSGWSVLVCKTNPCTAFGSRFASCPDRDTGGAFWLVGVLPAAIAAVASLSYDAGLWRCLLADRCWFSSFRFKVQPSIAALPSLWQGARGRVSAVRSQSPAVSLCPAVLWQGERAAGVCLFGLPQSLGCYTRTRVLLAGFVPLPPDKFHIAKKFAAVMHKA
jgi:hypothetical protein